MSERQANAADCLAKAGAGSKDWRQVTARVISSTYHYAPLAELDAEDPQDNSYFAITFSYRVDGELFVDDYKRSDALDPGHEIVILYNPSNPSENNLSDSIRKASIKSRIAFWVIGALLGALLIYLAEHYGWTDAG